MFLFCHSKTLLARKGYAFLLRKVVTLFLKEQGTFFLRELRAFLVRKFRPCPDTLFPRGFHRQQKRGFAWTEKMMRMTDFGHT